MIAPDRLSELSSGQKRRKLALTFGELERDIAGIAEKGTGYNFPSIISIFNSFFLLLKLYEKFIYFEL